MQNVGGITPRLAATADGSLSDRRYQSYSDFIRLDESESNACGLFACLELMLTILLLSRRRRACVEMYSASDQWKMEIRIVFRVLTKSGYGVRVNRCCGLHVHASHGPARGWTFGTVRSVSALFLLHEEYLDSVSS